LIYYPEETVFLRHARLTGHVGMNGKSMIIHQAAIAFYEHICRAPLESLSLDGVGTRKRILQAMERAW
jgi:shikimate 5-dehydrogenase